MPVTRPVVLFTVATEILELLHVPPGLLALNIVVAPSQTVVVPLIVAGVAVPTSSVAVALLMQLPFATEYVMVNWPGPIALRSPVAPLMVARNWLEELQVPPAVVFRNVVLAPTQSWDAPPVMGATTGVFVTVTVAVV